MEALNHTLFDFIFSFAHRSAMLDAIGVFFATTLLYLLVIAALIGIFTVRSGWRARLLLTIEGVLALLLSRGLVTEAIRFFYNHLRPFAALPITALIGESGNSFPSGHATFLFALAMTMFYANRKWGIWLFAFATLNGLARIFVGVHWPLDVIGGAAIGILSGYLVHWLLDRYAAQPKQAEQG
jgi:undecaprenyl-diphosphatase